MKMIEKKIFKILLTENKTCGNSERNLLKIEGNEF